MLTVGLLGGMSWESSSLYYRLLNERIRDELGGLHSAPCLLHSVDFAEIAALQRADRWDDAADLLARAAQGLEASGAQLLLLCTNTMHKVADDVQKAVGIPLLHICDTTAEAALSAGLSRVGLLGTGFTMEQDFYRDRLADHGLDVLVPGDVDRGEVHRIIFDELCQGIVRDESREVYRQVIGRLVERGAQGVLLACTEIELLISAGDATVPLLPTTYLHVEAAVARMLASSDRT